ncbi:MAG: glycosyltransferase [Chloroflexi bacterium]|nr:MAG: glycosyltransferase [Chloroflexota bacterium]
MRIGIIAGEYPPMQGGVGAYTQVLAEFLRQHHEVVILTSADAIPSEGNHVDAHIKRWNMRSLFTIRRWAKANQVDVLNIQFQTAAFNMSPAIHFLPHIVRHTPMVTTFHDLRYPYLFPKAGRLRAHIVKHLARSSNGVIVTNHEDRERVERMNVRHICFAPIGSNMLATAPSADERIAWREKIGAANDDFVLAHFGFINRSKGLEDLLRATATLREQNLPVKLLMIGGRTGASDATNVAYNQEIDALIEQLRLEDCIHWTGFVDDSAVAAYLTASDVVVLPYRDGASFRRGSLMAAIHYGCAIVTTTPSVDIPEFLDGENMQLVPSTNPEALTNALYKLYQHPEQRNQLRAGAALLAKHFEWHNIATQYVDFFRQLGVAG